MNEVEQYYKYGQKVGTIIGNTVALIKNVLYIGIIKASKKSKIILAMYVCIAGASIIAKIVTGYCSMIVSLAFYLAFILYMKEFISEWPVRRKRKRFVHVFEDMNFQSTNKNFPYFLYEKNLSPYAVQFAFRTTIALRDWIAKQETLAMFINLKIVDIKQDEKDNSIIYMIVESQPLPTKIEFKDEYINMNEDVLAVGVGYLGICNIDLNKSPHTFVAGETGSGKSNILKSLIYQSLKKGYEVELIDFKRGVSFSNFSDAIKISYTYETALEILKNMVVETERRLDLFRENRVDNINDYNKNTCDKLKRKILFIDELAELLKTRDKDVSKLLYDSLETLTRLSRATGLHLIMGVQRPDSTIINGQIKNNVTYRLCGRFVDKEPSRIMLNSDIASFLTDIKGRFIARDNSLTELQSFYYEDNFKKMFNVESSPEISEPHLEAASCPINPENNEKDMKVSNDLEFDFND